MATDATTPSPAAPRFEERQRLLVVFSLVTEVDPTGLHVRLSPLPGTGRHVPFDSVESVEVADYDAAEHGGFHWGVRFGGGNAAYRAAGTRGVRVTLADGATLFVGSRRPDELRDAVASGMDAP